MPGKILRIILVVILMFCGVPLDLRVGEVDLNPLKIEEAEANNLSVSSVSLTNVSLINGTAQVQFNISWDNSWRDATNYDAAWVFIKYSTDSGTTWSHATLKSANGDTNPLNDGTGWSVGSGTALEMVIPSSSTDKKGVFLQRSATSTGSVLTNSIKFVWNYNGTGGDGVSSIATGVRVKVFAIEMVYVPTGSFYLGSTTGSTDRFRFYTATNPESSYQVANENQITVGTTAGNLYYVTDTDPVVVTDGDLGTPIQAAFPKGFNAFYVMKYEISQGQYADFLNTLTLTQASARYPDKTDFRHAISGSHPNYTTVVSSVDKKDRACNWLSWQDIVAYADWAGLRPMTELEFEKAARGTNTVTANEYAWGNTAITAAATISGTENGTETITTTNANCNYNNTTFTGGDLGTGPLRCGIFAATASGPTARVLAGAGYYGIMELSGNLWEVVVPVGNTKGRAFTGLHGNGKLADGIVDDDGDGIVEANGNANVLNWPKEDATNFYTGLRGGNWALEELFARVSSRLLSESNAVYRSNAFSAHLVRTAP